MLCVLHCVGVGMGWNDRLAGEVVVIVVCGHDHLFV